MARKRKKKVSIALVMWIVVAVIAAVIGLFYLALYVTA